jgi:hypothetical protein
MRVAVTDSYGDANSNSNSNSYCNSHGDCNGNSYGCSKRYTYCYCYCYCDSYGYSYRHGYDDPNGNGNTNATGYSNAKAAADPSTARHHYAKPLAASAPTLIGTIGLELVSKLTSSPSAAVRRGAKRGQTRSPSDVLPISHLFGFRWAKAVVRPTREGEVVGRGESDARESSKKSVDMFLRVQVQGRSTIGTVGN